MTPESRACFKSVSCLPSVGFRASGGTRFPNATTQPLSVVTNINALTKAKIVFVLTRFFPQVASARSHPHTLHRLEQLALGLDARRNDDLRFLELANVRGADVAHAGGDGAHKILRAVV